MQLFLGFMVALSITAALIPLLSRWAAVIGLTDRPGERKVHTSPVPRVGGIAMAVGIGVPVLLSLELAPSLVGLLAGSGVLLAFGVWDDRAELGYLTKFGGQILAIVLCMAVGDVRIDSLTIGAREPLPEWLSWSVTFLFLLGVTNALNLADGLDGLAGGVALLCCCALGLLAAAGDLGMVAAVALIEAGAILGFLRFNTHPARVFMGDGGSQVLGFSLGVLAILATQADTSAVSAALPLLLLGVPILDTLAVMLIRLREGRSPFTSDRNHLHHKLLGLGFAHREAVVVVYALQGVLFLLAYFLRFESDLVIVATFVVFAAVLLGAQRLAWQRGWRIRPAAASSAHGSQLEHMRGLFANARLASVALCAVTTGLFGYAITVVMTSAQVRGDLAVLCLAMLLLLAALSAAPASRLLVWLERAIAYVSVALLVYLDETAAGRTAAGAAALWAVLAFTGIAASLRFWLSPTHRFEVTSLDVLVIFVALVVPNLPGITAVPSSLLSGVGKSVILLYVVELLLGADAKRLLSRAPLALLLSAIALRGVLSMHV